MYIICRDYNLLGFDIGDFKKEKHMKFKVGDKVRVRDDLIAGEMYNHYMFSRGMIKYKGKILTIATKREDYYLLEEEDDDYCFTDEMLETVKENQEITEQIIITREGSKMVGKYCKNEEIIETRLPYYTSELDFCEDAKVIIDRINEMIGEKNYSLIKCIGYRQNYEFNFTVDKIYKIYEDGKITDDNKYTYDMYNSKKDMLQHLSKYYLFEEIEK